MTVFWPAGELRKKPPAGQKRSGRLEGDVFNAAQPSLSPAVEEEVEISVKYAGYIERQTRQVAEFTRMEHRLLPAEIDYERILGSAFGGPSETQRSPIL